MSRLASAIPLLSILVLGSSPTGGHGASPPASSEASAALSGQWLLTLTLAYIDDFRVRMTIVERNTGAYEAYSRPGALRPSISWRQYLAGRLFGKLPPRLAAVRLDSLAILSSGDSALVKGVFGSPMFGTYHLSGSMRRDTLRADLRSDSAGPVIGHFQAVRDTSQRAVRSYSTLANNLTDTVAAYLFDPRLMRTPAWSSTFADLAKRISAAHDDADVMIAFYAIQPRLGASHFQLTHDPRLARMSVDSALTRVIAPPESLVSLTFPAPGVASLYIRRWQQVSNVVDRAFARIVSSGAHVLILDIRGNPGGDQSSFSPAAHLLLDSQYVGVLVANRWYRDHTLPPKPTDFPSLPTTANDDLLTTFRMLREYGVAVGRLTPRIPQFTGKVFLLVNSRSGSASEPLAYLLQRTKRATLVGEPTPGGILAAVPHPVGDGWVFFLPEGDYYTADGIRLEGRGVQPDIHVPPNDALAAVADSLRLAFPYAAALLSAQNYQQGLTRENLSARYAHSERWAREALRLAPDSLAPINLLAAAFVGMRRWEAGFALWDSLLAEQPNRPAITYQVGRFAALSGTHLDAGERALREYLKGPLPQTVGAATHAAAYWRLGMILEKRGDRAAALAAYDAGLALEPSNSSLLAARRALTLPELRLDREPKLLD